MPTADQHEERSQKVADALRAVLLVLATSGIGAAYAIGVKSAYLLAWRAAAASFVVSLACIIRSWFLAKDRALKRRDAARNNQPEPEIGPWRRSWRWDTASAWALIIGAALLGTALALA